VRSIPVIKSLSAVGPEGLARDVEAGRYFLPGAPTGERETLSPARSTPSRSICSACPGRPAGTSGAAVFTAGFFLLLTVQAYVGLGHQRRAGASTA
jgi:cytochrome c oxidase subunit I+III